MQRERLDCGGDAVRVGKRVFRQALMKQASLDAGEAEPAAQMARHRTRSAGMGNFGEDAFGRESGREVDENDGVPVAIDSLANRRGQRIDEASLDTRLGDHEFALAKA